MIARSWLIALVLLGFVTGPAVAQQEFFQRGDCNGDRTQDIADAIRTLEYLFARVAIPCEKACDINDDGSIDIADTVSLLSYLFGLGSAPGEPHPGCGADPTLDGLGCAVTACIPPELDVAFCAPALRRAPGIRLQPAPQALDPTRFPEFRFLMRPLTVRLPVTALQMGEVLLETTGGVRLLHPDGTELALPATIPHGALPLALLIHASDAYGGLITATHTATGTQGVVRVNCGLFPGLVGEALGVYPHFEFVRTIQSNGTVRTALDPARHAERVLLPYDVYIVAQRTPAEWALDPTLVDVTGEVELGIVSPTSILDNIVLAWSSGLDGGSGFGKGYDVVLDFGLDGTLDPGDIIAGLSDDEPGFSVVKNLTQLGPHATTTIQYSGGTFLGQKTYFPTPIDGLGELPLVIIGHGNGHLHTWYDYLGHHLASYGYVVMSHQNDTGPGIDTAATTTLTNTEYLLANMASIGGGVLANHIDRHRIAWIGHSRGGEAVARAYDRIVDGTYIPVQFAQSDIRLISSIAPTIFLGVTASTPHAANYHLLAGAADGDVTGGPDCSQCQFFRLHQAGTGNKSVTYVHGASHNDFNCCGVADGIGPGLIGRPTAQAVAKVAMLAHAEWHLRGNPAARDFLTRSAARLRPQGISTSVVVANQWKPALGAPGTNVIEDYQSQSSITQSSSGGSVTSDVTGLAEGLLNDANTSLSWFTSDPWNGMTQAENAADTSRAAIFDWSPGADRFYELEIPPSLRDLRAQEFVSLRAAQGSRHPNTVALAGTLHFTVTLIDGTGTSAAISTQACGGITRPYLRSGLGSGSGWASEFCRVRLRVSDFETDGSDLDLGNIVAIRFDFGAAHGSDRGRLAIDDIQIGSE